MCAIGLGWFKTTSCKLKSSKMSFQPRLHIIVKKISGLPNHWTKAIASIYFFYIFLGPSIKDKGKIICLPTFETSICPTEFYQQ